MASYDPVDVSELEQGSSCGGGLISVFVRVSSDPAFSQLRVRSDAAVATLAEAIMATCEVACPPSRVQLYRMPDMKRPLESTYKLSLAGVSDGDRIVAVPAPAAPPAQSAVARTVRAGVGFGTALAISISYTSHRSIVWAILHGCCGWLYVLYYAVAGGGAGAPSA